MTREELENIRKLGNELMEEHKQTKLDMLTKPKELLLYCSLFVFENEWEFAD